MSEPSGRRERIAELEGENNQLRHFLYVCPIGVVEVAVDGTIGMVNPYAMKLLVPVARTPVVTNFFTVIDPHDPELRRRAQDFKAQRGVVCDKHRIRVPTDSGEGTSETTVLACTLVKLDAGGFVATLEDVSGQVAQELRLRQAEIAELDAQQEIAKLASEANAAKSAFLAMMSHEIRTPMNAILGMAEALSSTNLDAKQRAYVDTFRRSGATLSTLINDVLDLSKIEAGQMTLEHVPFELAPLANDVIQLFEATAAKAKIDLILDLADEAKTVVLGDSTRLGQVLQNLVGNALKFTQAGSVTLRIRREPDSATVSFAVSDTGIGIAAEKLDSIFDHFTQAATSTTRKFGGTGLGLPICRQLVKLMGGEIVVESETGSGSTFRFSIPLEAADRHALRAQDADAAPETEQQRGLRILVAEDVTENRFVLEVLLQDSNHQLTFVADGQQAVDASARAEFDLILMDVQMPVMDGLTATRKIREHEARLNHGQTPIVALTADAGAEDFEISRQAGCNSHLTKPVSKKKLLKAIQSFGRRRAPIAAAADERSAEVQEHGPSKPDLLNAEVDDAIAKLIPEYLIDLQAKCEELADLLRAPDFEGLKGIGHFLLATGAPFGFPRISDLGAALQTRAKAKDLEESKAVVEELMEIIKALR